MKTVPVTLTLTELELAVGFNGKEILEAALKRYLGLESAVMFGKVKIGDHIPFDLPPAALIFIQQWDNGDFGGQTPVTITIDVPEVIVTPNSSQNATTFVPPVKKWELVDEFKHI